MLLYINLHYAILNMKMPYPGLFLVVFYIKREV